MRHHVLALLALASAAGVATTGPAGATAPTVDRQTARLAAADCSLPLGDAKPDESDGALVLLLDGTLSSSTQDGRVDDLAGVLDAATLDRRLTVSVGSFGGSDADVHYDRCLDGVQFVATGNNARTRERNRARLLDDTTALIGAMQTDHAASDPTTALRAGVRRLAEAAPGSTAAPGDQDADANANANADADGAALTRLLVIHTDGIPTAGCAALPAEVDISTPGLIDDLVASCVDSGQLPDATGIDVVIGGIARTDTTLSNDVVTFLIRLNTELCEATGASCRVDPNFPTAF